MRIWNLQYPNVSAESNTLDLFHLHLPQFTAHKTLLHSILSDAEAAYIARLRFQPDRTRLVLAHGLLRLLLAERLRCQPSMLRYDSLAAGRFTVHTDRNQLTCAIAVDGDQAIFGFGNEDNFGVDVKQVMQIPEEAAIIRRFFSVREQALLSQFPSGLRTAMFFQYLARKSAFCKAIDEFNPPALHEIDVAPPEHGLTDERDAHAVPEAWRLISLQPTPGYAAALALYNRNCPLRQVEVTEAWLLQVVSQAAVRFL